MMEYKYNRVAKPAEPGRWWVEGGAVYDPCFDDGKTIIDVWFGTRGIVFEYFGEGLLYSGPIPEPKKVG